jgi:hypothetical protein
MAEARTGIETIEQAGDKRATMRLERARGITTNGGRPKSGKEKEKNEREGEGRRRGRKRSKEFVKTGGRSQKSLWEGSAVGKVYLLLPLFHTKCNNNLDSWLVLSPQPAHSKAR